MYGLPYITDNALITYVAMAGYLRNSTVFERVTLNWSTTSKLGWSNGKKIIQYIDNTDAIYADLNDVSIKMKYRANVGYGLKVMTVVKYLLHW